MLNPTNDWNDPLLNINVIISDLQTLWQSVCWQSLNFNERFCVICKRESEVTQKQIRIHIAYNTTEKISRKSLSEFCVCVNNT